MSREKNNRQLRILVAAAIGTVAAWVVIGLYWIIYLWSPDFGIVGLLEQTPDMLLNVIELIERPQE